MFRASCAQTRRLWLRGPALGPGPGPCTHSRDAASRPGFRIAGVGERPQGGHVRRQLRGRRQPRRLVGAAAHVARVVRARLRRRRGGRGRGAAERQDLWKRAVANRKKVVSLVQVKGAVTKASIQQALQSCKSVREFRGKPGAAHKAVVLSCDLLNQKGKEPWLVLSPPAEQSLKAYCEYLTSNTGACDVLMAFDGCARPKIEE